MFLSYSRTESPLVADLAPRLRDVDLWIDYQNIAPGDAWEDELLKAVDEADVLLLLVSPRSMRSSHVRQEWQRALGNGVRVVLAIVEPAPLPAELRQLEWIDLRWRFGRRSNKLSKLLTRPSEPPSRVAPTGGRRASFALWRAVGLATVAAVASVGAFWTIVVPLTLIPLPRRILRRDFDYRRARVALAVLPWVVLLTTVALLPVDEIEPTSTGGIDTMSGAAGIAVAVILVAFVGGWGTLYALATPEIRRWMQPRASRPPRRTRLAGTPPPESVGQTTFRIEAAPEDGRVADELTRALLREGHQVSAERPQVIVHLVSTFHDTVEIDHTVPTIPVLLADPDDELPHGLRRTQWVDLRRGLGWWRRTTFAALLADREELMRWLGTAPPHGMIVRPGGVEALETALLAVSLACGGRLFVGAATELIAGGPMSAELQALAVVAGAAVAAAVMLVRAIERRSRLYRRRYLAVVIVLGLLVVAVEIPEIQDSAIVTRAIVALDIVVLLTVLSLSAVWIGFRSDIRRWLPDRRPRR